MIEILDKAIRHYGRQHQKIKAIEELGELQGALLKCLDGRSNIRNITEEIADVEIMLAQLKKIYFINPDELDTIKANKILRLESRMKNEVGLQQ